MQINKLKKGSWVGNLVKHAKHDKIRKQWEQTAVSMKPLTWLTVLLHTPDFCLRIRQRTIALSGWGFQGAKCQGIQRVAELVRVRTIGHTIRILTNSATNEGNTHLESPALSGPLSTSSSATP